MTYRRVRDRLVIAFVRHMPEDGLDLIDASRLSDADLETSHGLDKL